MDSAIEKLLEVQAAVQDYDDESSFEVISDSDDPVSSETDHSPPAKPLHESPAPTPTFNPETGNKSSSSLVILARSRSADKNVQSVPSEIVDETPAPAPKPEPETGNEASSSLVILAGSGSACKHALSATAKLVAETIAPAPTPDPETGNAASFKLVVLAGSGSADNNFQDENSLEINQYDRERDQRRTEKFSALNSSEKEWEINNLSRKVDFNNAPYFQEFGINLDLQPRLYHSMPELSNLSDEDDTDNCSIDIIDEQNEVNLNNVIFDMPTGMCQGGRQGGQLPPQILADQLTLSRPGGAHYPHPLLPAPPDF